MSFKSKNPVRGLTKKKGYYRLLTSYDSWDDPPISQGASSTSPSSCHLWFPSTFRLASFRSSPAVLRVSQPCCCPMPRRCLWRTCCTWFLPPRSFPKPWLDVRSRCSEFWWVDHLEVPQGFLSPTFSFWYKYSADNARISNISSFKKRMVNGSSGPSRQCHLNLQG